MRLGRKKNLSSEFGNSFPSLMKLNERFGDAGDDAAGIGVADILWWPRGGYVTRATSSKN